MTISLDLDKFGDFLKFLRINKSTDGKTVKIVHLVNYLDNSHRKVNRAELVNRIGLQEED